MSRPIYYVGYVCFVVINFGSFTRSSAIRSFHELEQVAWKLEGGASSFAAPVVWNSLPLHLRSRPSVAVSFEQGSRPTIQTGLSPTFALRTIEEIELN